MNDQNLVRNLFVIIQQREGGSGAENACRVRLRSHPSAKIINVHRDTMKDYHFSAGSIIGAHFKSLLGSLLWRGIPNVSDPAAAFPLLDCFGILRTKFRLANIKAYCQYDNS
jgi:hypothetical protein